MINDPLYFIRTAAFFVICRTKFDQHLVDAVTVHIDHLEARLAM
jgi:hypothetical protein